MKKTLEINDLLFSWNKKEEFHLKIKSFFISDNDKVILFGKSGTGKSTLLNLISGILSPCSGTIKVKNIITNNLSQADKDAYRANNIGVIFQQFNILDYISPLTNILLPCFFTNFGKKNSKYFHERAVNLAEKLNLQYNILVNANSKNLSVGQIQRISIIRAIINEPKLILADEPTSALDDLNKKRFLNLLIDICEKENITLLMVSHDTSIKGYFDKHLYMEDIIT